MLILLILNLVASEKIIGGNEVEPFSKPYVASLFNRGTNFNFCGATLISPTFALTAAHCVRNTEMPVDIYFHRHNHTVNPLFEGAILRHVEKIILHPRHNGLDWDFALLHFSNAVRIHNPIKLDFSGKDWVDIRAYTVGWGLTQIGGSVSDVLRGVAGLRIWSHEDCSKFFNITDRMICIGGEVNRDSCNADSGGLAAIDMTFTVIGMVSWGRSCGLPLPAMYAKISTAEDFIRANVHDLEY